MDFYVRRSYPGYDGQEHPSRVDLYVRRGDKAKHDLGIAEQGGSPLA